MVDHKRLHSGAKTPGQGMAGAMVPLEVALSGAIGARVRITTAQRPPIEGTLFTADPVTNLVAINTADPKNPQADYRIFPISRIQSFQLLSLATSAAAPDGPSFAEAVPPVHALDTRALKNREASAVAKLHESEARRGKGVTREAQDIFDAISRTMPVRWDGTAIVVADAVTISAPYRPDDCRPLVAGDNAALLRVRKVLEMERQKIELRNASAAIGSANAFSRASAGGNGNGGAGGQRKGG
ncbi:anticodon-binding domain-containing protein [Aspergillus ambiguus]|uniref:anticodon-binding domain-containing protein n=1 Tax=Aspergillus ambiguus TaxID=176160 RepID=UPI003CCE230C